MMETACVNCKFDHCSLQQLLAARSSLTDRLCQVSQLQGRLTTSEKRLRDIVHRLPLLEEIMAPLQDRANVTNSVTSRIDAALKRAASVLHIFKAIQAMQKNLNGNPKADLRKFVGVVCCLERYMQMLQESYEPSLDWFEEVVVFLKQTRTLDSYGVQKLTDMLAETRNWDPRAEMLKVDGGPLHNALQKLEAEFERLVVEHSTPLDFSSLVIDESDSQFSVPELSFSPVVIGKLLVIMDRLKANGRLQGCLQIFWDARAKTVRKGMSSLAPIYLQYYSEDAIDRMKWEQIHDYIFSWVQHLKVIVKVVMAHERELCHQVFQTLDPSECGKCLEEIAKQSNLSSFFRFSDAVARSRHRPEALLIGLLDLFKGLQDVMEDARDVFEGEGCLAIRAYFRESQKPLVNNAWRVFLEFVKTVDTSQLQVPKDGGKDMNASFVVNYMGMLLRDYGKVLEQVLGTQVGGLQQQQQSSNLSVAVLRVMSSLERSLESRATRYEDAVLSHVFLMNNYRHVLVRLKECVALADCLGDEWKNEWRKKVDQNLRNYIRKSWEKVLLHLSREGLSSSSGSRSSSSLRDMVKTKLRAFNTAFEDTYNKQCTWVIVDPQLRETTRIGIIQLLIPAYHSFLQSFCPQEDGAASHKSIKYTADALQTMVGDLFEGSPPGSAERSYS